MLLRAVCMNSTFKNRLQTRIDVAIHRCDEWWAQLQHIQCASAVGVGVRPILCFGIQTACTAQHELRANAYGHLARLHVGRRLVHGPTRTNNALGLFTICPMVVDLVILTFSVEQDV